LLIIPELGASIVATGATASAVRVGLATGCALAVCFAGSATLWWLYFDRVAAHARGGLARSGDESGVLARDAYTYLHIPIVAGIVLVAVGDELVIAHPGAGSTWFSCLALAGGAAVYLVGHLLFRARMTHTTSRPRIVAVAALLVLVPVGRALPQLALAAVVACGLAILAVIETRERLADERRAA